MLGLEPDVLGERLNVEGLGIRTSCNYYPPCPQPELVLGLTPHSDSSIFTVLQQDGDVFGLETLHNGQWFQVPPLKNAFVINGGNQLQVNLYILILPHHCMISFFILATFLYLQL